MTDTRKDPSDRHDAAPPARGRAGVALAAVTLFAAALAVFWVQLFFTRLLLPAFGGTPAVWTGSLVFFQAALLLGYLWAHGIVRAGRLGVLLHGGALAGAAVLLPIVVRDPSGGALSEHPLARLVLLLVASVGAPFVLVAATAPLLQSWAARAGMRDPYVLYAASNLGSVAALLLYPFALEPALGLAVQGRLWAVLWAGVAVLVIASRALLRPIPAERSPDAAPEPVLDRAADAGAGGPDAAQVCRWLVLAFVPAGLLYGVTLTITTDIAPVPLLWVLPLGLYLGSFVLAFARRDLVPRSALVVLVPPVALAMLLVALLGWLHPAGAIVPLHAGGFFLIAWLLHGDLAAARPAPSHLTGFYLAIAAGGLAAGLFCAVGAPLLFTTAVEYPIAIALAVLLVAAGDGRPRSAWQVRSVALAGGIGASLLLAGFGTRDLGGQLLGYASLLPLLVAIAIGFPRGRLLAGAALVLVVAGGQCNLGKPVLLAERSFFGVHRVVEDDLFRHYLSGTTVHGRQRIAADRRREPLAYYDPRAPIGETFGALVGGEARVAVVGLGIGGLAAHAQPGQTWRFYEIDPTVATIARRDDLFTYLADAPTRPEVVIADGRLALERETAAGAERWDVLVLDAFTSDAVPVHLLTVEAFATYEARLAPGGRLIVNVSNRFLDLERLLAGLAARRGLHGVARREVGLDRRADRDAGRAPSHAIVLARELGHLEPLASRDGWRPLSSREDGIVWTDDHASILPLLRLR